MVPAPQGSKSPAQVRNALARAQGASHPCLVMPPPPALACLHFVFLLRYGHQLLSDLWVLLPSPVIALATLPSASLREQTSGSFSWALLAQGCPPCLWPPQSDSIRLHPGPLGIWSQVTWCSLSSCLRCKMLTLAHGIGREGQEKKQHRKGPVIYFEGILYMNKCRA